MIAALKAKIQSKITNDKHFAELIKGSGVAFILRIVGIAAGYLFTLLVTRSLGAEAWGNFALSLVVLQIASVIGRLGMDMALLRFTAGYLARREMYILRNIYRKSLSLVIPLSIFIAVLLYFLSPVLALRVFRKAELIRCFRLMSFIVIPFVVLYIHTEGIRGLKKIKEYMILQQVGVYVVASILFVIGFEFIKVFFLPILSYAISVLIFATISIYLWRRYIFYEYLSNYSNQLAKNYLSYRHIISVSFPMLLSSSLLLIIGWTDTIMLGMFRSASDVGIYNVALRISMLASLVLMAINTIAAPMFAECWGKKDKNGLSKIAKQVTKVTFWASLPLLVTFAIFPKFVLGIFGKEFVVGATALRILTVGQFINAVTGPVAYLLNMTSYEKVMFIIWSVSSVLVILLNIVLIPGYGIDGAAFSTMISHIWSNLVALVFVRKKLGFWTLPYIVRN